MPRKKPTETHVEQVAPEHQPEQSHAESVGNREPRYNHQGIIDRVVGARLLEHHNPYLSVIRFEEKPSDAIREKLRDSGFRWAAENQEWVRPIRYESRAQDRIHAERTFEEVTAMIRKERGITHEFGG